MLQRISFVIALAVVAPAASFGNESERLGQAAEDAGRFAQALAHYTVALQSTAASSDAEQRLLERAASIAAKVHPLPALPAEAERRFVRGQTAVQMARDSEAFQRAADEFRAAARAAPWFADAYYNLGVVLDKAQRYPEAIRALNLYMLAAPSANDAGEAKRLVYQIEFRQEEAVRAKETAKQSAKAEQERRLRERRDLLNKYAGELRDTASDGSFTRYRGEVRGDELELRSTGMYSPRHGWASGWSFQDSRWVVRATENGLEGTFLQCSDRWRLPAHARLIDDSTIEISHKFYTTTDCQRTFGESEQRKTLLLRRVK